MVHTIKCPQCGKEIAFKIKKKQSCDYGLLYDWFISSVSDTDEPVWTPEHLEELLNDFYVIPKRKELLR